MASKYAKQNAKEMSTLKKRYSNSEAQAKQLYDKQYKDYVAEQQRLADQQTNATRTQYQNRQRSNYLNYMMNQRDLPEQLARLGVTGGASESAQLRANTNYENVRNATNSERDSAISKINNELTNNSNAYKLQQDANLAARLQSLRDDKVKAMTALEEKHKQEAQERKNQKIAKTQRQYERYKDTIRRFDSISKVDKAIRNAKKSGAPRWKIQLLQAQRADLVAAGKTSGGSSGSGGGSSRRRSSGSRYSSSGSSGSKTKKTKKSKELVVNRGLRYGTNAGKSMGSLFRNAANKYI